MSSMATDFFLIVVAPVASVMTVVGGLLMGGYYLECKGFAAGTGIETRWEWGCYAKVDGQWVPKDYAFGNAHELRMKDKR